MSELREKWNESYRRLENFAFYPHEELIRFLSKYIKKRIGFDEFSQIHDGSLSQNFLDLGCGIGRHIRLAGEYGLVGHGIDLSDEAVQVAIEWAREYGVTEPERKIKQGETSSLPWPDEYFGVVASHGVLDSMPYEDAILAVKEVGRVLVKGGYFYCDLISGDDSEHGREYAGEERAGAGHEEGTIQSYFNYSKIQNLFGDTGLAILDCVLVRREDVITGKITSRYHLSIMKKRT